MNKYSVEIFYHFPIPCILYYNYIVCFLDDSESEGEGDNAGPRTQMDEELEEKLNDPKLGAKKKAKLEAKAEKRAAREAEERLRDERKQKQAADQKERELYVAFFGIAMLYYCCIYSLN